MRLTSLRIQPKAHYFLVLLLSTFFVLGTVYSVITPLFEAPDEYAHFRFIQHLAIEGDLPVLSPVADENVAFQEGGQAPLYYFLAARLTAWAWSGVEAEPLLPNPHGGPGHPSFPGSKNVWQHGRDEDFPYTGRALVAHMLRIVSVSLGMLTIVATYLAAREVWPTRPAYALGAAAINAFNPQFIFISSAITNDVLAAATGSACIWLILRMLRRGLTSRPGRHRRERASLAGRAVRR